MKPKAPVQLLVACILAAAVAVAAIMCCEYAISWKTDFSSRHTHRLSDETVEYLSELGEPVLLTFAVTGRDDMPSDFKRVEQGVVQVLAAMKRAAPQWVDYEVIDPSRDDRLVEFMAEKKVSQYHVESISEDRKSEKVVWSSLVISRGDARDAIVHGITQDYVPFIEQLVVGHLTNMKNPVKPTIGLYSPAGYSKFEKYLTEQGTVQRVSVTDELLAELDILYIMEPPELEPDDVYRLKRFLETGRTIVLADSLYRVGAAVGRDGDIEAVVQAVKTGTPDILNVFGLEMEQKVLMDEKCEYYTMPGESEQVAFPIAIKSNPTAFNLKNFSGTLSGNLSFMGASVISHDALSLRSAGYDIQTVVTSSDRVWTTPLADTRMSSAAMSPTIYKPKQPLIVQLTNRDPFFGRLLVIGSPSMFSDAGIEKGGFGHRPFLKLLGRTYLSSEALVKMRVDRSLPPRLPAMSPGSVISWRIVVIFLLPALALVVMLIKMPGAPLSVSRPNPALVIVPPVALAAALVLVALMGMILSGMRLDFTDEKLNTLSEMTVQSARESEDDVKIELYAGARHEMPASMKQVFRKTLDTVSVLARRSGGKVSFEVVRPDLLPDVDRAELAAKGIAPREIETTEYDIPVTKEVWNGMRITGGGAEAAVPFISDKNVDSLEFFLVSSLQSLKRGRPVSVSMASDMPRLSPAEAYEDFFKKQLSAPIGSDVYREARRLLEDYNFGVEYVDPKSGEIPPATDLFVWMQPRRPVEPMAVEMGNYLASGGSAVVAMQHFNIQQRQYGGRGFQTVYWPQPQYMDLNNYLDIIGVPLVREVLMDEVQSAMALEMQINRLAIREYEEQEVSRPFLIRAIPPNYDPESPVTSRLGDLLFIWGNRLLLNEDKLNQHGLQARALVKTSERAWSFDWSGGFLGDEVFAERNYLNGPQPLAVLLQGSFPPVHLYTPPPVMGEDGRPMSGGQLEIQEDTRPVARPESGSGKLLLFGNSEMFKNQHLYEPGFYHGEFLLKAVAYMTMGPNVVELLSKEYIPRGFETPGPRAAVVARIMVIGGPAAAILLFCVFWFAVRGRKKQRCD